jgi:glycosyltransferase involved in cell wall biosynthesis
MKDSGQTNTYPKITIVTQCYNREEYIAETIESVLSQNYINLEYIIIDDGSTDKSWEIIQRYKNKLAYIEHLDTKRDTPVPAINYGFSKATGEIMTWLNSKNILLPKSLFTIAQVFTDLPEVDWVTGVGTIIDGDGKIISVIPVRKDFYEHMVGTQSNIQQESTFWRRTLWEKTGEKLNEETVAFDIDLWSTKFFLAAPLYHLNTLIGAYRKSPTAFSSVKRATFLSHIEDARKSLRSRASTKQRLLAGLFRVIRYLKPILRNIPDRAYAYIPILNNFQHRAIKFATMENGRGVLKIYSRNPFRTIFPW